MFWRKKKELADQPNVESEAGWSTDLLDSFIDRASDRGLGFRSKDYFVAIDGLRIEQNNSEIERKAYGTVTLRSKKDFSLHYSLPVVIYFIVGSADYHESFSPPTPNNPRRIEDVRPIGKAMLNGIGFSDVQPVLEWHLYPSNDEWSVFLDAFKLSTAGCPPVIGARIGLPESITPESIIDDGFYGRLLIYRLWFESEKVFCAESLKNNYMYQHDRSIGSRLIDDG